MARIFIVDDNLMIRTQLRAIFSDEGHDVVGEAQSGLEAPSLVQELRPDLVTLDLVMPGRDGLTTLNHLMMIEPSLRVVVCSASLDQHKLITALKLGAKGVVAKPIDRERVLAVVRDLVGVPGQPEAGAATR